MIYIVASSQRAARHECRQIGISDRDPRVRIFIPHNAHHFRGYTFYKDDEIREVFWPEDLHGRDSDRFRELENNLAFLKKISGWPDKLKERRHADH